MAGGILSTALDSSFTDTFRFDYDQALSGYNNKLTYLTPVFNGFQAGAPIRRDQPHSSDFGNWPSRFRSLMARLWRCLGSGGALRRPA